LVKMYIDLSWRSVAQGPLANPKQDCLVFKGVKLKSDQP
jgi:hypothetical protein